MRDADITTSRINELALIFVGAVIVQTLFTRWARMKGAILGEWILADLREDFLTRAVALPLGAVERAGTGDLSPGRPPTLTGCRGRCARPFRK